MKTSAEGRAPGRLDVLGGVADYSGAWVLEMALRLETTVHVRVLNEPTLRLISNGRGTAECPATLLDDARDKNTTERDLHTALRQSSLPSWTYYPVGCVLLFALTQSWSPPRGLEISIHSSVPEGSGVSSSAALEVATLRALENLTGIRLPGTSLARLAQQVENQLVGAPCGLMDQLTSAHGIPGHLLPILCRPDILQDTFPLPDDLCCVGWPSGVKHSVADHPYARARAAAFMGKRLLEAALKRRVPYLTDFTPADYHMQQEHLPLQMSGEDFLDAWKTIDDPLSTIQPGATYPVQAATAFAIHEHDRTQRLLADLRAYQNKPDEALLWQAGGHLYASHDGYSAMGLGSPETNRMVDALRILPPSAGIYGARISGGGCGGTVSVLLRTSALPRLREIAAALTPGQTLIE